jgi:citrate synthase
LRSGVHVCDTFGDVAVKLEERHTQQRRTHTVKTIGEREQSMIVSHISGDVDKDVQLLGRPLLETIENNSIASLVLSMLLGSDIKSKKAEEFIDYTLRLLVDHGPYVSGALNTIVTARAGRDLVSSLAAGLLTVGPRFGGAINTAAECWLYGVNEGVTARQFIEGFSQNGGIVPGIGHKKYRLDLPDPRVSAIKQFAGNSNGDRYLQFALNVEAVTTTKKATLILNVDGVIAAILLDILESELRYTREQLQELIDIEFFNALFVLSRSVGFTAHYLDQRRHDEGLFRLPDKALRYLGN